MKNFLQKAAVAFVLAAGLCVPATAKADLVSSMPAANAPVYGRIQQIALTFSEGINIEASKINVRGAKGLLRTTKVAYDAKKVVLVTFWQPLALGKYTVDWHIVSSSNHKSHGTYTFIVKSEALSPEASVERVEPVPSGPVDLNTASADDLAALPGIRATRAAAIIAGRPYASVGELVSKGIITQANFDRIKTDIVVAAVPATPGEAKEAPAASAPGEAKEAPAAPAPGKAKEAPAASAPVDVNTASVDEIDALPGVGPTRAAAIVAGRPYKSIDDLLAKGVVPRGTFETIKGSIVVTPPAQPAAPAQ